MGYDYQKRHKWADIKDRWIGNEEVGYRTGDQWCARLDIAPLTLLDRAERNGLSSSRTYAPKQFLGNAIGNITNPFTGRVGPKASHARERGVSVDKFSYDLKKYGINDERTWAKVSNKLMKGKPSVNAPIWLREEFMSLRQNPFTSQWAYDYEWAELYGLRTASFRDRLRVHGVDNIVSWSFSPHKANRPKDYYDIQVTTEA